MIAAAFDQAEARDPARRDMTSYAGAGASAQGDQRR
jgi:hypothetical protein